jgi:hypothetical protein
MSTKPTLLVIRSHHGGPASSVNLGPLLMVVRDAALADGLTLTDYVRRALERAVDDTAERASFVAPTTVRVERLPPRGRARTRAQKGTR